MPRLTAIVSLLCLTLSRVQAKSCGYNQRSQCVPRHLCVIGSGGPVYSANQGCNATESCCPADKIEKIVKILMKPLEQTDCGLVNENGRSFTMQSSNGFAQENELPWMTALINKNGLFMGGGSLIASDVVITANHVISNHRSGDIFVRAGDWDILSDTTRFPHIDVAVRMIVRHPEFVMRTAQNNLALLFLDKPLEISHHIRPICLPPKNKRFDTKRCIISGWGKDDIEQINYTNILKKVELPVLDSRICESQLQALIDQNFRLHTSLMCAGGEEGKSPCTGDGGSPLACPFDGNPKRFEIAGIVSCGIGCGLANTPGLYTDVAKFRSWIDDQINAYSIAKNTSILEKDELLPGEVAKSYVGTTQRDRLRPPTKPNRITT